jgi:putative transposase
LRKLVDYDHPKHSVSRKCELLGLPRSLLYYQSTPVRESTLQIMARIDALYLEDPCSGSRFMVEYPAREGMPISRNQVRNLMRRRSSRAICQKPRNTVLGKPSEQFPCLMGLRQATKADHA